MTSIGRPAATLDRDAIAARIPHAGSMCLLDEVVHWDDRRIECTAAFGRSVAAGTHPLESPLSPRSTGQSPHVPGAVPATAAIEYAAQAMAVHGTLMLEARKPSDPQDAKPRRGFLAGLRSVQLHCRWLDGRWSTLVIRAERFAGDDVQVLYDFEVSAQCPLAQGPAAQDPIVRESITQIPIVQGRAVVILDAAARAAATV